MEIHTVKRSPEPPRYLRAIFACVVVGTKGEEGGRRGADAILTQEIDTHLSCGGERLICS